MARALRCNDRGQVTPMQYLRTTVVLAREGQSRFEVVVEIRPFFLQSSCCSGSYDIPTHKSCSIVLHGLHSHCCMHPQTSVFSATPFRGPQARHYDPVARYCKAGVCTVLKVWQAQCTHVDVCLVIYDDSTSPRTG